MTAQQPNPRTPAWAQPAPPPPAGGWGPPPPAGGWGVPPQPPKKKRTGLKVTLGVVGAIIVISVIGAAANSGKKNDDSNAAAAPSATATTKQPAAEPAPTKATHKPKPAAKTVLTESGRGIKSTEKFTVSGDWDLHYTYDCTSFGMQGNFAVTSNGGDFPDVLVNELGKKGSDVTHQHDGGTIYLDVNSECSWTIKVVDLP